MNPIREAGVRRRSFPRPDENLPKKGKISSGAGRLFDIAIVVDIVRKQTRPVLSLTVRLSHPNLTWLLASPLPTSQPASGTGD